MNEIEIRSRKLISLDQCFLSKLAIKRQRTDDFKELLSVLLGKVRDKKIICPAHYEETKYESVKLKTILSTRKIISLQNNLSLGVSYLPLWELVSLHMLNLVRPATEIKPIVHSPIRLQCDSYLANLRVKLIQMDKDRTEFVNQMSYPPKDYQPGSSFDAILKDTIRERKEDMLLVLRSILNGMAMPRIPATWELAVAFGESLIDKGISRNECLSLIELVKNGQWEEIPMIKIHNTAFAKIEQGYLENARNYRYNDHPDVSKLSVSLVYADIATCDKGMKEILKQSNLLNQFRAKVYAMNEIGQLGDEIKAL